MDKSERYNRDALIAALTEAGAQFRGNECRCPFHQDKRASAGVYENSGVWRFKCHSCNASGDVYDIRSRVRGVPLADVLPKEEKPLAQMKPTTKETRRTYPTIEALAGTIKERIEARYEYTPDFVVFRVIGADGDKIFKQVHKEGNVWLFCAPPKPWPLYGREGIGTDEYPVVVVEGEKCVEALRSIGLIAVTSPCGAGKAHYADWTPLHGREVILWPDNDAPGLAHMQDVAAILKSKAESIRVVDVSKLGLAPKGDVVDLLECWRDDSVEAKRAAILKIIREAEAVTPAGDLVSLIENTISGKRRDIPLPWGRLSRLARPLLPGSITLLCGSPGCGKSFMLLEAAQFFHNAVWTVAVFVLEEDRAACLLRTLTQLEGDSQILDPDWMRGNPEAARAALARHQSELDTFAGVIHDAPTKQPTIADLAKWTREQAAAGVRLIIVDPLSVADFGAEPWNAATKFMVDAGKAIRDYGASLILALHPRKGATINGLLDMDGVAGGAAFTRLAQSVLWLEPHTEGHAATIHTMDGLQTTPANRTLHILKARNGPGQGARLAFHFSPDTLTFDELGIEARKPRKPKPYHPGMVDLSAMIANTGSSIDD